MFQPPGECPVCGTEVQARARACPECGADERSGWREIEFAEDSFDYQEFLAREFGQEKPRAGLHPLWWITALILLAGSLLLLLSGRSPLW